MKKLIIFIMLMVSAVSNAAVNTWDMQGRPIVMYSDSEAIIITGKVRHKRHHPVKVKNGRRKYKMHTVSR